jgi:predicted transposase/invertase (TIGR01784 family)
MVQYRKQRKKIQLDDPLNRWLVWLDVGSPPELIEEVIKMDSAIQAANERMIYVTGDKEAMRAYEMRQMALSDYTSSINYAREEGFSKGRTEGRAEGILEIARKMKEMGDSIEKIQIVTGLPQETIEQMKIR